MPPLQHPNTPAAHDRWRTLEHLCWAVVLIMSIAVMIFRGSKWDGPADMPQERDFATYVFAARAIGDNPLNLYHERLWIRPPIAPVGADQPYLYPPAVAWLMRPFTALPFDSARKVWFWLSISCIVGIAAWLLFLGGRTLSAFQGAILFLLAPSTMDSLYLGQITFLLALGTLLGAAGIRTHSRWKSFLAGCFAGMAIVIKPITIALGGVALLRGGWRFLLGMVVGMVALLLLGAVALPGQLTTEYYKTLVRVLSPSFGGLGWQVGNQSLVGFWHKFAMAGHVDGVTIRPLLPQPWARLAALISLATVGGLTLYALVRARKSEPLIVLSISIACLATILASSFSWWHFVGLAPPIFLSIAQERSTLLSTGHAIRAMLLPCGYLLIVIGLLGRSIVLHTGLMPLSSTPMLGMTIILGVFIWRVVSSARASANDFA